MISINLYGGPGTGKSTTMAALFAYLKLMGHNVEMADEFAKQLTWTNRMEDLTDQLYVFAKQQSKLRRVDGKVTMVVTDSPLILSEFYAKYHKCNVPESFYDLVRSTHKKYDNVNIFLNRIKPYEEAGRGQNEAQAKEIDIGIRKLLIKLEEEFTYVDAGWAAGAEIYEYLIQSNVVERNDMHDQIFRKFIEIAKIAEA